MYLFHLTCKCHSLAFYSHFQIEMLVGWLVISIDTISDFNCVGATSLTAATWSLHQRAFGHARAHSSHWETDEATPCEKSPYGSSSWPVQLPRTSFFGSSLASVPRPADLQDMDLTYSPKQACVPPLRLPIQIMLQLMIGTITHDLERISPKLGELLPAVGMAARARVLE